MVKYFFTIFNIFFIVFASQDIILPVNEQISITPEISTAEQISIPLLLNYQGKLTDNNGNPVPDSNYSITFRLFNSPTGGTAFWSETKTIQTRNGLFHTLLGSITPITSLPLDGNCYLEMQVNPNPAMSPRIRIVSSAYSYIAKRADTANYAQTAPLQRPINPPISTNEISDNAITSAKIQDATILGADLNRMGASTGQVLKWTGTSWQPGNDEVGGDNAWVRGTPDSVLYTIRPLGISRGGVENMLYGPSRYTHVNLGIACTTGVDGEDIEYCVVGGGRSNKASGPYATICGGVRNIIRGYYAHHATIGGGAGNAALSYRATVGGGGNNTASDFFTTVGGGNSNLASGWGATVSGGYADSATGTLATIGGGWSNIASGWTTTIGGGYENEALDSFATVSGGKNNSAKGLYSTVGGGYSDTASGASSVVCGGWHNVASGNASAVLGGDGNTASGAYSAIAGGRFNATSGYGAIATGYADTSAGNYSFTTNNNSLVPSAYSNSAAFNGQTATASGQLRCGTLSKAGGTFTIDHPIDPYNKILNHYFVEGPEMLNIYRGFVILDANGKAEVKLPDYFSALNRNPHIQLTGVGTSDVYVLEKIKGNTFVIGGKPGTEVYWQVTAERADISAEVIRRLMPVEQEKTGELRGRMLDDEFLGGCMEQLEREGKANGINFRTPEGRKRYEDMKRTIEEIRRKGE